MKFAVHYSRLVCFSHDKNAKSFDKLKTISAINYLAISFPQQIKVYRHKILARFGLMHMIGTNLSVWFSVLIQETKHEILTFYDPENRTLKISHRLGKKSFCVCLGLGVNHKFTRHTKSIFYCAPCLCLPDLCRKQSRRFGIGGSSLAGGEGTEGTAQHIRVQTIEHFGDFGTRRVPVSMKELFCVQSDLLPVFD